MQQNISNKIFRTIYAINFMLLGTTLLAEQNPVCKCQEHEFKTVWRFENKNKASYLFQEDFDIEDGVTTSIVIKGEGPLETVRTPFQVIDMYDTVPFGKMLVLDGIIQLTQYDNFAYHEMIAHVPLNSHPNPRRVLIVGGGDGGTLKEVLKHQSVQEVVLCEIDAEVIRMAKKYFPELACSYKDPRVTVITEDATAYIKTKKNYFDVICVDSSDPIGPAVKLFEKEFYQDMKEALTEDGIATTQGESMFYYQDDIVKWNSRNSKIFKHASYYYTLVPTYASGTIGFLFCSKKYKPFENLDEQRVSQLGKLKYYSADMHKASFTLPAEISQRLYRSSSNQ